MAPVFPTTDLAVEVDMLINSTWTNITKYVYQRDPIQITGMGRADWTSQMQAGSMTLTLNNRDGRFTPNLSTGAFYPYVNLNTQIRVSIDATSVTGVTYSGYRFWGEVSEWPPQQDVSSNDWYVSITASGIWRRLSQLQTTIGSAYRRYNTITLPANSQTLQGYWPMEDGAGSEQLVAYGGASGTANAVQNFVTGQPGLSLAGNNSFPGSDGIPVLNAAEIVATVASGGTPTNNVTRFLLSVPAGGDSASGTTDWNLIEVDSAGTVAKFQVFLNYAGTLAYSGLNSGGSTLFSGTTTTNVQGKPVLVSLELTPSGSNVAFAVRLITPGASGITESDTGTITSASIGAITTIEISRAEALMDTAVGHLAVSYETPYSLVSAAYALNGYIGEYAMTRFTRVCGELGIATETIGTASATAAMGPQVDDTIANVLQMIESTDMGLLYETQDQFGLGYRGLASMANQSVAATFNWNLALLDPALTPIYDDSLTWNNITVTNWDGYTQQAILTAGARSIQTPPNGIGNGYSYTRTVSADSDTQIAGIATWLLNVGSVNDVRYPVVTFQQSRTQNASIFSSLPSLRIGDYFQITNPPARLATATIQQLVWGWSETINSRQWTIALNAVSELPYATGFSPGTVQTAQIPGSAGTVSTAPGAGGVGALIANGSITPAMLNQGITIHTLGGNAVTIAASAPSNPNTDDIWINSGTGLISEWNGSSWAPVTFNATDTIQAGTIISSLIAANTIVASNIAAGTITAALLAAGIVVAGIVNATTVQAASYIATNTQGEFLAYSGTPASGNLETSLAGASGSDTYSNAYPAGFMGQQLTLVNQASGPPAFSGASVFYSSTAGRPRYVSSAGADAAIDRSTINVANWLVSATTSPTAVSAPLAYLANEGNQSSEYEIEIIGTFTWPASGFIQWLMQLYVDGLPPGGSGGTASQFTVGTALATASGVLGYRVIGTLYITAGGSSGTAQVSTSGFLWEQSGSAVRNPTTGAVLGANSSTTFSIDCTANHTFQMAAWNSSGSGSGGTWATTRTRLTRRM